MDVVARAELFENKALVLSHFSQIYSREETARLLAPLADRIRARLYAFPTFYGEPWMGPAELTADRSTSLSPE